MDLSKLDDPFPASDIEWRIQRAGKTNSGIWARVLAYVTNRAIMKRLDEVCGKTGWRNEYLPAPDGGVMCGISIKINGEWITKWDAAENTQVEAVKGGMSGAMKRAAVQWGIGRYLYDLTEGFASISTERYDGYHLARLKDGNEKFYWAPPALPDWALPTIQLNECPSPASEEKHKQNDEPKNDERTPEQYLTNFTKWALECTNAKQLNAAYKKLCKKLADSPELAQKANEVYQAQLSDIGQNNE